MNRMFGATCSSVMATKVPMSALDSHEKKTNQYIPVIPTGNSTQTATVSYVTI
jgi:hypothetical protein